MKVLPLTKLKVKFRVHIPILKMCNTKDILAASRRMRRLKTLFLYRLCHVVEMLSLSYICYSSKAFIISWLFNCFQVIEQMLWNSREASWIVHNTTELLVKSFYQLKRNRRSSAKSARACLYANKKNVTVSVLLFSSCKKEPFMLFHLVLLFPLEHLSHPWRIHL